jgi:hypothetical protein
MLSGKTEHHTWIVGYEKSNLGSNKPEDLRENQKVARLQNNVNSAF